MSRTPVPSDAVPTGAAEDIELTAYTDESGNSGLNLFDPGQPWFWTGTLLTPGDLESGADAVRTLAEQFEIDGKRVTELHGAELGVGRLEQVAPQLAELIVRHDCTFVFTQIEKRHIASGKLADTLLDAGNNTSLSFVHYNARALRLPLAAALAWVVSEKAQEDFWRLYERPDAKEFRKFLRRLRSKVQERILDPRTRHLLVDAINFGLDEPLELLAKRSPLDSPNAVAFSSIIHALHQLFGDARVRIKRFIHDRQSQFGPSIRQMYEALRRIKINTTTTSVFPDVREAATYQCGLEVTGEPLVGLQLVDVVLWLAKRTSSMAVEGACGDLLDLVAARSVKLELSRNQLFHDAEAVYREVMSVPMAPFQLARGAAFRHEIETARLAAIRKHRFGR